MADPLAPRSTPSQYYHSPPALRRTPSPSTTWSSGMTSSPTTPRDSEGVHASRKETFTEVLFDQDYEHSISPTLLNMSRQHEPHGLSHAHGEDDGSDHGDYYGQGYRKSASCEYDERQPLYQHYSIPAEDSNYSLSIRYPHVNSSSLPLSENESERIYTRPGYEYTISPEGKDYNYTHTDSHSPHSTYGSNARDATLHSMHCVPVMSQGSHGYHEDSGISEDEVYMASSLPPSMAPRSCGNESSSRPHHSTGPSRRRGSKRMQTELPLVVSSNDKPHICDKCNRRFRRPEDLRRHGLAHTGERPFECSVHGCKRRFSRTDNLRAHRRTHTTPGGRNQYVPELDAGSV